MIERIGHDFRLGGHKAAAVAMVLRDAEIYLVSEMDPALVRRIFLQPFSTVAEAYRIALQKCGPDAYGAGDALRRLHIANGAFESKLIGNTTRGM